MFTTFVLLAAAEVSFRLAFSWTLRERFDLCLSSRQALAGALVVPACLPDWIMELPYPFPVSFILGALLSDFLTRRA